jgi:hypothetical protein
MSQVFNPLLDECNIASNITVRRAALIFVVVDPRPVL